MATLLVERGARGVRGRDQRLLIGVLRRIDYLLIASALVLTGIGIVMIYSATHVDPVDPTYYVKRQLLYAVIGVVTMIVTTLIDYRRVEEWAWVIYGIALLSLLAVRAVGKTATQGAEREINIKLLNIQPSEFAVVALVIVVAMYVHRHEDALGTRALAKILLIAAAPMGLVYLQPDLGTTMIMGVIVLGLLLLAGFRLRLLALIAATVVGGFLLAVHLHILEGYQLQRLTSFLHQPSEAVCLGSVKDQAAGCYQLAQSKIAIGAGGLSGTGLLNGAETTNGFVPYAYADFIFSAIGEQLGFVGSALVVGLYAVVAFRLMRAMQLARDSFGRLVCGGTLLFLAFSVFQNVGMTIGIMPITGIPLPFISFGGSALFALYAAIGLVLNVELRRGGMR